MRSDEIKQDARALFVNARAAYLERAHHGEHDSYAYAQMSTIALLGLMPMAEVDKVADEGREIMNARHERLMAEMSNGLTHDDCVIVEH
jgi:hypothetical protein